MEGDIVSLAVSTLIDVGLDRAADVLHRGFSDYLIPIEFAMPVLLRLLVSDGIDLAASRIASLDGRPVGAMLIARRGWSCRLAGMAIVPDARGRGIGRRLMQHLVDDAIDRGDRSIVLEVIEANRPAVSLYERFGFRTIRRLVSFERAGGSRGSPSPLENVDIWDVARRIVRDGLPDLPWQISGETLARFAPPYRAVRLDSAYAILSDPATSWINLHALFVEPDARGAGRGARLLRVLSAAYPGRVWSVPALCPEEFSPVFLRAGFAPGSIHQLQMIRELR